MCALSRVHQLAMRWACGAVHFDILRPACAHGMHMLLLLHPSSVHGTLLVFADMRLCRAPHPFRVCVVLTTCPHYSAQVQERREFLEAMRAAGRANQYEAQVGASAGAPTHCRNQPEAMPTRTEQRLLRLRSSGVDGRASPLNCMLLLCLGRSRLGRSQLCMKFSVSVSEPVNHQPS